MAGNEADSPTAEPRRRDNRGTITNVIREKDFGGTAWDNRARDAHKIKYICENIESARLFNSKE